MYFSNYFFSYSSIHITYIFWISHAKLSLFFLFSPHASIENIPNIRHENMLYFICSLTIRINPQNTLKRHMCAGIWHTELGNKYLVGIVPWLCFRDCAHFELTTKQKHKYTIFFIVAKVVTISCILILVSCNHRNRKIY